jgi:hypothetical protein
MHSLGAASPTTEPAVQIRPNPYGRFSVVK